ncbi:helix-turn-helix domain-containing protein [Erwinia sp. CPCC 100877]|nr:helix-turn-helix domain-containing protein [Erwinia sp. CPCC 100877]
MILIGHFIKQKRIEQNITQTDLAKKIGVSRQTISNWENDRTLPDIDYLIKLAQTYNLSLDQLLAIDSQASTPVETQRPIFLRKQLKRNLVFLLLFILCAVLDIRNAAIVLLFIILLTIKQSIFDFFQLNIGR